MSGDSASDVGLRVDVFDSTGAKLDAGPVTKVLAASYTLGLGLVGSFKLRVSAEEDKASILTEGNEVRIFRGGEGLVFRGLIEHSDTTISEDGATVLTASGPSIARQLVWEVEDPGSSLNAVPIGVAVTRLLDGTGWGSGAVDAVTTTVTTTMDGASRWVALQAVADCFGFHLRENNRDRTIDIGAFGTNPQGIVFQNVEAVSPNLQTNPRLVPIQRMRIVGEATDVINSIVPRGQGTGITGEQWTLEHSTRTTPYTIQTRTGPDGKTVRYLEDSTSVSTYGRRKKVLQFKTKQPLGLSSTDFENAANSLYDQAVTWLQRHKDKQIAYEVTVVGLKHFYLGQPLIESGNVVKVIFNGIVEDIHGRRAWKSVNANLYVMDFTRTMADEKDEWNLTVSTVPRMIPDDGNVTAQFLSQIHAVEAAPLPFVLFGDNIMRIDRAGVQIATEGVETPSYYFVTDLVEDPTVEEPRVQFSGYADPDDLGGSFDEGQAALTIQGRRSDSRFGGFHVYQEPGVAYVELRLLNGTNELATPIHFHLEQGDDASLPKAQLHAAPMQFSGVSADPSVLAAGLLWYDSSAAQFYVTNGFGNKVAVGGGMELIVKDADETVNNSTTLQDDDELFFPVAANENWQFEGVFWFTSGGTPDIKYTFVGPTGAVGVFNIENLDVGGSDSEPLGNTIPSNGGTAVGIRFTGAIANGANAGNLKFQWAQLTADASNTTVLAGSYLKFQKASS